MAVGKFKERFNKVNMFNQFLLEKWAGPNPPK